MVSLLVKMRFWNCVEEQTLSVTLTLFPWGIKTNVLWWSWRRELPLERQEGNKVNEWHVIWVYIPQQSQCSYYKGMAVVLPP